MSAAVLPRILLVEDDPEMRSMLRRYLGERGFNVQALADPSDLDRMLLRSPYDILLLDLSLPGEDGLSICRRLRVAGQTVPILMLTARGDATDRIVGLEMGADDYLGKPFEPRELIARINSLLRRQQMIQACANWAVEEELGFGPFKVSLSRMELTRDGEVVPLTSMEFQLLRIFLAHPRRPLSRDHLLDRLKGAGTEATERSIDVQISRLRQKVEVDSRAPLYLRTVWGVGYLFVPDGQRD